MTRSIPGRLDYAALLGRDRYRPLDRDAMRAAVTELAARGLKPRDVAQSLSISEAAVRDLLGPAADSRITPEIQR